MAATLGYVVLISLGAFKLTEFYKEVVRRAGLTYQMGWWKSFVNLVICGALALLVDQRDTSTTVLIAIAAAGLGALWHGVDTVLRSHRDDMVTQMMSRNQRRR